MVINFYCPVCSAPIRGVPDAAAGRRGSCIKCGARIPVPNARRVDDDDIVAILRPVNKDVQPLSASVETVSDHQPDQSEQRDAGENTVEVSDASDTQEVGRRASVIRIISRSREFLRRMLSRLQRFDLRSIRRRKQLRSLLRRDERFIVASDEMVLTNQRLLSLISHEVPDLENVVSAFASDGRTSSDLILHSENERHVFFALERQFAYSVVASIRTMLSIDPGSPTLPNAARETSHLYDVVFGQTASKQPLPHSVPGAVAGGFAAAMTGVAPLAGTTTERMLNRHQNSGDSVERARMSATTKLWKRGYRIESQLESERLVRAMRNCDVSYLSRLVDDPSNKPLRCGALAALRDLGSQAAAAIPALRRLLDSDELRITRTDATKDDLLLLTAVSETYLAVSNDGR